MITTNITFEQMHKALKNLNKLYDNNICFNRFDELSPNRFQFTLKVLDSHKTGARRSLQGHRMTSACWHVHGHYFEELIKLSPTVKIRSRSALITKNDGNWQDQNIGSLYSPMMHSEACECSGIEAREIPQKDLTPECWSIQFKGLKACEYCEFKDTKECGGQEIRKKLTNEKGIKVPLGRSLV